MGEAKKETQYLTAQKEQRLQELVASFKRWYDGQFGGPGGVDDALSSPARSAHSRVAPMISNPS